MECGCFSQLLYVLLILDKLKEYEAFSQLLYICIKDYKAAESVQITEDGYRMAIRDKARQQGFDVNFVALTEGEDFSSKPCQIFLTERLDFESRKQVLSGLNLMRHVDFAYKLINKVNTQGTER